MWVLCGNQTVSTEALTTDQAWRDTPAVDFQGSRRAAAQGPAGPAPDDSQPTPQGLDSLSPPPSSVAGGVAEQGRMASGDTAACRPAPAPQAPGQSQGWTLRQRAARPTWALT